MARISQITLTSSQNVFLAIFTWLTIPLRLRFIDANKKVSKLCIHNLKVYPIFLLSFLVSVCSVESVVVPLRNSHGTIVSAYYQSNDRFEGNKLRLSLFMKSNASSIIFVEDAATTTLLKTNWPESPSRMYRIKPSKTFVTTRLKVADQWKGNGVMTAERLFLAQEVAELNPFNSTVFIWTDILHFQENCRYVHDDFQRPLKYDRTIVTFYKATGSGSAPKDGGNPKNATSSNQITASTNRLSNKGQSQQDISSKPDAYSDYPYFVGEVSALRRVAAAWRKYLCEFRIFANPDIIDKSSEFYSKFFHGYNAAASSASSSSPVSSSNSINPLWTATRRTRYCITTMISSKAYVRGANLLAATIKDTFNRQLLSDVTLIGLLLEGRHEVNAYSQEHAKHWSLRYEGLISAPDIKKVVPKFKDQFTKLALWSWVQFERVVYIDSDCIALGDLSPFLTQPKLPFAAVRDFEKGNIQQHFNMGVFSFKPDVCEYHRLLALKTSRTNYTMAFAEQAFLNAIYGKEYEEWPFVYNGNIAAAAQAPVFWREKFSKLRILHYTLIKPFEPLVTKQRFYAPLKAEVELWYRLEEKATKEALAGTAVKMSSL